MSRLAPLPALLGALLVLAASVLAPTAARAEQTPRDMTLPVRLVVLTAGVTWEDVSPAATPALSCLAGRSAVGAMNTTSVTPVSTLSQGEESVRTGYRGHADQAPRSAGIPDPPVDRLADIPGGVQEIDAREDTAAATAALAAALAGVGAADAADPGLTAGEQAPRTPALVVLDLGGAASSTGPGHAEQVRVVDERLGAVIDAIGGCGAADLPRTLVLSVGAGDDRGVPAGTTAGPARLQIALDTGAEAAADPAEHAAALTSGATHQAGLVVLTDVLPTILASHRTAAPTTLPGQPFETGPSADPVRLATDRSQAAARVDPATVPALGSWILPGILGLLVLAVPALARRPRPAAAARAALSIAPLCIPVGLCAGLVPWWRAAHPALALTGVVWAGGLLLAAITLLGPWRRRRLGPPGVAGALVAGIVLLESATGSRLQVGSPLGAQPISGGRYYGLSNHLFGAVLAASLLGLLALFSRIGSRRARVILTAGTGAVIAGVCVAPTMGADFGSMLVTIPTFGLLALLVSGIRLRPWHVLALGAGGVVTVLGVSLLDWLRPPAQRTHLGRFIDEILSGQVLAVVVRKLAQNITMLSDYWPLAVLMVLALAVSIGMLAPRRLRLRRLLALDAAHPEAYPVRLTLVVGTWLGYAVNDTGPVLVAAAIGVALALLLPMLPSPVDAAEPR